MSFEENLRKLQVKLRRAGYAPQERFYDLDSIKNEVEDIKYISREKRFDILYVEAKSNWRKISSEIVKDRRTHCLIFTRYDESHMIVTAVRGAGTIHAMPRHLVIESGSTRNMSVDNFIKSIRVQPNDTAVSIGKRIHETMDKFADYKNALKEFAENLDVIIDNTRKNIDKATNGNEKYRIRAEKLLKMFRKVINETMELKDIRDMLIQHILTYRIFSMVYNVESFHASNAVARELEKLKKMLNLDSTEIDYSSMEIIAESLTDTKERQEFLKRLYETFYEKYDPKTADRDGIVYTPSEVVDFMIKSTNELLKKHFGKGLFDKNVMILDPFTGTGTFVVHMLEGFDKKKLEWKYKHELHANEISILPYYIAALNIENAYRERTNDKDEFEGICWMDTFERGTRKAEDMDMYLGYDNIKRVSRQQNMRINVIIGNPPYSVGQKFGGEDNQNVTHKELENRITETYSERARNVGYTGAILSQNDSYIKAFRWASDRIGKSGIVAFITNGGFIKSDTAAGLRACIYEEFTDVWCYDLRGKKGRKNDGRNIFEYSGTKAGGTTTCVAITILVKNPRKHDCIIHYAKLPESCYSGQDKRDYVEELKSITGVKDWRKITPNEHHDWVNQRGETDKEFKKHIPIGVKKKDAKILNHEFGIFTKFSNGIKTHRDNWVYNSSFEKLAHNMRRTIEHCAKQNLNTEQFDKDPKKVAWTPKLSTKLKKLINPLTFNRDYIRIAMYRPFLKQYLYFDTTFINDEYAIPSFFPLNSANNLSIMDTDKIISKLSSLHHNSTIIVPDKIDGKFSVFITNVPPDLEAVHHGQCFPMKSDGMIDNITDLALNEYKHVYDDDTTTKEDIFYYVYGILHHNGYRKKYQASLVRGIPHIPMAPNFWMFSEAGRHLADLHLNYEKCDKYPLDEPLEKIPNAPKKIRFGKKENPAPGPKKIPDPSTLYIDGKKIYGNIPELTYKVNGRTPVEWFVNRYGFSKNSKIGNMNYPLERVNGEDVRSIIERLVHVGVESDRIMGKLEKEEFEREDWKPQKTGLDAHTPVVSYQSRLV